MKKILLLSDTHSHMDDRILHYAEEKDEIWHAGDIGTLSVIDSLEKITKVRAVYGNIDGQDIRKEQPLNQRFTIEGISVWMTHIGGYPPNYNPKIREELSENPVDLLICGHSHILKVIPDKKRKVLHMNPGAAGIHGFHKLRTMLQFEIDKGKIQNLSVIELGERGSIT